MSDLLVSVRESWQNAVSAVHDVSSRAPGSPTTQALVLGALLGLAVYKLSRKRYHHPPGPRPWPLLGNVLLMNSKTESFYVTLKRWAEEKYGPVITVFLGPMRCVTLNNIDVITEALVQKGSDFADRPWLYSMNVMTEGYKDIAFAGFTPAWKLHRKIGMQAIRHYMRGPQLETVVHDVVSMVLERMLQEPGPFEPHAYSSKLFFHLIHQLCFGEQRKYDDAAIARLIELFETFNSEVGNGFLEDIVPLLRYWPTAKFSKIVGLNDELLLYINDRIEEHKKCFSLDNIRDMTDSILLAQSEAAREESEEVMAMFTDTHVRQTISDLFGAGVDTSRMSLDWAMLFLAGHPQIQKRVQQEIDAATGSRMPAASDRAKLQYTEATLYETMRLGSVAPMALPHRTLTDTTVGGYDIPKNTMVMANLWAALHDSKTWDKPMEFNPERFLDDRGKLKTKADGWIPFSMGRRVCMGESVARPELVLVLACMLKKVTLSLPQGETFDPSYIVQSLGLHQVKPYRIVVTPR